MKKKLLIINLLFLSNSCLGASHSDGESFKSGYRVGGETGYKYHSVQHQLQYGGGGGFGALVPETVSQRSTKNTAVLGVHGAYDYFWNDLYTSLEISYRYSPGDSSSNLDFVANAGNFTTSYRLRQAHRHDLGLNVHLGSKIGERFLGYGILGVRLGQFQDKVNVINLIDNVKGSARTQWRLGGTVGLGARYALPSLYSVGVEATYSVYKSPSNYTTNPATGHITAQTSKIQMFNLIFKVSKNF